MNKIRKITAGVLCVALFGSLIPTRTIRSSADGLENAPAETKKYPISSYASAGELTSDGGIKFYSYNASTNTLLSPVLVDGSTVGFSGGKALQFGSSSTTSRTIIVPQPYNDTVNNHVYDVTAISGKRQLSSATTSRVGSTFLFAKNQTTATDASSNTVVTDTYVGNTINMQTTTSGLQLVLQQVTTSIITTTSPTGTVTTSLGGTHSGDSMKSVYLPADIAKLVTSDTTQQGAIATALGAVTSLSTADRWVDYKLYYKNGSLGSPVADLTMNLSGVSYSFTVPLFNTNTSAYTTKALAIGSTYHQYPVDVNNISDITVTYDLTNFYKSYCDSLIQKINAISPLTSDKQSDLLGCYNDYIALNPDARKYVTNIDTVTNALAAFNKGAYYYDDFSSGKLNWQIAGHISNTGTSSYDDNLTETNTYSTTAASDAGDASGKAFWGIGTDSTNASNSALWLRKSFNINNMIPINNNNQTKPSVIAVTKGVLPSGAKVQSVSGSMYLANMGYGGAGYKQALGIAFKYSDEYSWKTIGVNGSGGIASITRTANNSGSLDNSFNVTNGSYSIISNTSTSAVVFKPAQWITFSLNYDFKLGCYTFTMSGLDASNVQQTETIQIGSATSLLTEVGLVNAAPCVQSFDNISISLVNSSYIISQIDQLPDASAVTLTDENNVIAVEAAYNQLSDTEKANVTNHSKLIAVRAALDNLILTRDGSSSLNKTITFENGEPGINYFESVNAAAPSGWQVADNPYKTGLDTSEKVLSISRNYNAASGSDNNRSVYKLKDVIMPGNKLISNISGKAYLNSSSTTTLIYDYKNPDSWQGLQLSISGNTVLAQTVKKTAGSNLSIGNKSSLVFDPVNLSIVNGVWVNFNLEYSLLGCTATVEAVGTDGRTGIGQYLQVSLTLLNTCETKFAVATGNSTDCYLDDIKVNFQDTSDYMAAKKFKSDNSYILNLIPASAYISDIDRSYITKAADDYGKLSAAAKADMSFMDVRIQHMKDALNALDSDPNASAKAAKDQQLLANKNAATGDYSNYTYTDDFEDGTRAWQPAKGGLPNTGSVTTVYNAEFGSNVLKMTGISTITLKDILLPGKPQVASVSYRIKLGEASDFFYRLRIYNNYHNDSDYKGYGFYQKTSPSDGNYRVVTPTVSATPTAITLDLNTIWTVNMTYSTAGKCVMTITDGNGAMMTFGDNTDLNTMMALCSFGKTTYIDDLKVTYRKGNYDTDITNKDITVYYTANTWVSTGDIATASGENIAANVASVEVAPVENGTISSGSIAKGYVNRVSFDYDGVHSGEFSQAPSDPIFNESKAQTVDIVQKAADSVKFVIPKTYPDGSSFKSGIYAVKFISNYGGYKIVYINSPVIDYTVGSDGQTCEPGGTLRVIGKNLSPDSKADNMHVLLVGGGTTREIPVTAVQSNYSVSVKIPSDITVPDDGNFVTYELWLYSGYGDSTCWAIPTKIKIAKSIRSQWKGTVFNVADYGATGSGDQNATPYIVNALSALSKNGGGVLYLPDGTYSLEAGIIIPQNCVVRGESKIGTAIVFRPYNWDYGNLPQALINFEKNVEFDNFSIYASRVSGVFRGYGASSDNVYVNNVRVYAKPTAGTVTDTGKPYTALLSSSELASMVAAETVGAIFSIQNKGDNVQMKDFDLSQCYGNNRPIVNDVNGSQYWQVDNISTRGNWSEVIISNSIWENSSHGPDSCMGVWGHGLYFANNHLFTQTINNRELYVADRSASYAGMLEPLSDTADNVEFQLKGVVDATITQLGQLYIRSGQGVGQTRTIIAGRNVTNSDGTKATIITVDRPFTIAPNRNSSVIVRKPRENIYFVGNKYEDGACCGFYGGFADVVYDNDTFTRVFSIYQQGIFNDVNWYLSIVNCTILYDTSLSSMGGVYDHKGFDWEALSGVNAQMCFLLRDCDVDGMYTYLRANSTNSMVNVVIDNNDFSNNDYAFTFYNNATTSTYTNIDGMFMTRNRYNNESAIFDPATASVAQLAMQATNPSASKRLIVLDQIGSNTSNIMGDVNGDGKVDLKDCTLISLSIIGQTTLGDSQAAAADVDGDHEVTLKDATMIKLYILGKINSLNPKAG